jgi:SAM-dependent methyltransferase
MTDCDHRMFFGDAMLDEDLPKANEDFWSSLIGHIEDDRRASARVILDIGCHTGGLLHALNRRFAPAELFGIEPLAAARIAASKCLHDATANVVILDISEWHRIPSATVDILTSHEMLYLEPNLRDFMKRIRRVLAFAGVGYVVLGCHSENPLWPTWKKALTAAGHTVYDHRPLDIMEAASSEGLLPSVQPLRRSGWITYDPLRADFQYPDIQTMFDHHYRYKLIFRLHIADDRTTTS